MGLFPGRDLLSTWAHGSSLGPAGPRQSSVLGAVRLRSSVSRRCLSGPHILVRALRFGGHPCLLTPQRLVVLPFAVGLGPLSISAPFTVEWAARLGVCGFGVRLSVARPSVCAPVSMGGGGRAVMASPLRGSAGLRLDVLALRPSLFAHPLDRPAVGSRATRCFRTFKVCFLADFRPVIGRSTVNHQKRCLK